MLEMIFKRLCAIVNGPRVNYFEKCIVIPDWMTQKSGHVFDPDEEPSERIDYKTSVYRYVGNYLEPDNSLVQVGIELLRGLLNVSSFCVAAREKLYVITYWHESKKYTLEESALDSLHFCDSTGEDFLKIIKQNLKPIKNVVFKNSFDLIGEVPEIKQPVEIY